MSMVTKATLDQLEEKLREIAAMEVLSPATEDEFVLLGRALFAGMRLGAEVERQRANTERK